MEGPKIAISRLSAQFPVRRVDAGDSYRHHSHRILYSSRHGRVRYREPPLYR